MLLAGAKPTLRWLGEKKYMVRAEKINNKSASCLICRKHMLGYANHCLGHHKGFVE